MIKTIIFAICYMLLQLVTNVILLVIDICKGIFWLSSKIRQKR